MQLSQLTIPRYSRTEVLSITRLKPELLQSWVERKTIVLQDHTPGHGRRRMYSPLDVVKLAILRRMADFSPDLSRGKDLAEAVAQELISVGEMPWDLLIPLRPSDATASLPIEIIRASQMRPLAAYSPYVGDAWNMRVAQFIDPVLGSDRRSGGLAIVDGKPVTREHMIDPRKREAYASYGIHAEPVLIFPLGEIVNGTLAQLRAIDEAEAGND